MLKGLFAAIVNGVTEIEREDKYSDKATMAKALSTYGEGFEPAVVCPQGIIALVDFDQYILNI
ncbi:hypothetical protein GCM10011445_39090 [Pseudocitrobacter faecalis]|nr:hypothetical protein GCM10011445_39090 [Pseudocitrobacter faecalis]